MAFNTINVNNNSSKPFYVSYIPCVAAAMAAYHFLPGLFHRVETDSHGMIKLENYAPEGTPDLKYMTKPISGSSVALKVFLACSATVVLTEITALFTKNVFAEHHPETESATADPLAPTEAQPVEANGIALETHEF